MPAKTAGSVYLSSVLVGIAALIAAVVLAPKTDAPVMAVVGAGVIFLLSGFVAGVIEPSGSWRAGAVVAAPLALSLLVSLAFSG